MYSVGQERRLVDPPSQVVAGVRTVTTNMDGRDALPRMSRPFAFIPKFDIGTRARIDAFAPECADSPLIALLQCIACKFHSTTISERALLPSAVECVAT